MTTKRIIIEPTLEGTKTRIQLKRFKIEQRKLLICVASPAHFSCFIPFHFPFYDFSLSLNMDSQMDMDEFKPNEVLWTQEDIQQYRPGGFHPVSLGDSFKDSRYIVRHKLGFSGLATEWLAKDNTYDALLHPWRYIAANIY